MTKESLALAIRSALVEEHLPCESAFQIAWEQKVAPAEVGQAADEMGVRVSRCQLGLFGYGPKAEGKHRIVQPAPEVPTELAEALRSRLQEGRLPCAAAWAVARQFGLSKLEAASAAEALGIRISHCQLGCF